MLHYRSEGVLYIFWPLYFLSIVLTVLLPYNFFQVRQMMIAIMSECGTQLDDDVLEAILDKAIFLFSLFSPLLWLEFWFLFYPFFIRLFKMQMLTRMVRLVKKNGRNMLIGIQHYWNTWLFPLWSNFLSSFAIKSLIIALWIKKLVGQ